MPLNDLILGKNIQSAKTIFCDRISWAEEVAVS
jgi:hypothetical protein